MSFEDDLRRFERKVRNQLDQVYNGTVVQLARSIVEGSALTGAPGQPVRRGDLKRSWRIIRVSKYISYIMTQSPYAHIIEDNRRGAVLRSKTGGFHSVKLTRAGFHNVVRYESRKAKYSGSTGRWHTLRT